MAPFQIGRHDTGLGPHGFQIGKGGFSDAYIYAAWLRDYLVAQGKPANAIWTMDDLAGSTTMVDLLGNHDGTWDGGPSLEAAALVDDDGTSAGLDGVDDSGRVPDAAALDAPLGRDHTVLVWAQCDSTIAGDLPSLFFKGSNPGYYGILEGDGNFRVFAKEGTNSNLVADAGNYFDDSVHLFGMTINRTDSLFENWVDAVSTTEALAVGDVSSTNSLEICDSGAGGTRHWPGFVDVAAVIPYKLTAAEWQKIYDVGVDRGNR